MWVVGVEPRFSERAVARVLNYGGNIFSPVYSVFYTCLVLDSLHRNCSSSYLPHAPLFPVFTVERALDWDLRQLGVIALLCHQLVIKDEQTPVALPLGNEVVGLVANFPDCLSSLQLGSLPSPVSPAVFICPAPPRPPSLLFLLF